MGAQTEVALIKRFGQFIDPNTRMVNVDPKVLAHMIANMLDMSQSALKPFAVNEQNECFIWNPQTETWVRTQLKDIYAAVRRDPTV